MSFHIIRETVKHCLVVPYIDPQIAAIVDAQETGKPVLINGWSYAHNDEELRAGSEMYGYPLTKGKAQVLYVICEGDDCVYFVARRAWLAKFAADLGITQTIQKNVELTTAS